MKPVNSKKDFVKRYQANEFGNRSPTWDTVQEFIAADPNSSKLYHLRSREVGALTWYNKPKITIRQINKLTNLKTYYVSEMAPTEHTLIQGEIQRQTNGLHLRYTTVAKPMRAALLTSQEHVWGLSAKLILQHYLDPRSFEWLGYLLDTYTDHVVEFSTYGINFGTIPRLNTIIWEVRNY